METLKILFVVVLCLPIFYFGVIFAMRLLDNAVASKKKKSQRQVPARNKRRGVR